MKGLVHYGIAGNANPQLQIGDVTIPQYWAHTGLWNWQVIEDNSNTQIFVDFECTIETLKYTSFLMYSKLSIILSRGLETDLMMN